MFRKPPVPAEAVLVHGAFSDASYWHKVIPILHAAGLPATAAHVEVRGFAADVAAVRRHLDARADADFVLVGHSYGGAVITEVGALDPRVKALVFVAAVAPEVGVTFGDWMNAHPCAYQTRPVADASGNLMLPPEDFVDGLAPDLDRDEAMVAWALHKPVAAHSFGDAASAEGWRRLPCWYLVTEDDRIIPPDAQRALAQMMGASTRGVASGHMVALSRPERVAAVVREAFDAVAPAAPRHRSAPGGPGTPIGERTPAMPDRARS